MSADQTSVRVALLLRQITPAQAAKQLGQSEQEVLADYERVIGRPYEADESPRSATPPDLQRSSIPADAPTLDALGFLSLVLPHHGWFATQTFLPSTYGADGKSVKGQARAVKWHSSHEDMVRALLSDGNGQDAYYATATFKSDTERKKPNAASKRAFQVDLDVAQTDGVENKHKYNSLAEAEAAVQNVINVVGLMPTIYVRSGGGVHLYWALEDELPVEEWQPLADEIRQRLMDANILFDTGVTVDAVKLMRMPGTYNHKPHLQCPLVCAWKIGEAIPVETARSVLAPQDRPRGRQPRPADKPVPDDDTYWQRTRISLLQLSDEALLRWMGELFERLNAERWDVYDTWIQVVLACKPIADTRESLYEPVLELLVKFSARSSHAAEDVAADIEKRWASANNKASLLSAMREAGKNGWVNTMLDKQGRFLSPGAFAAHLSDEHVYVKDLDAWVCVSDGRLVTMRAIAVSEQSRAPLGKNEKPVSVEELLRNDPCIRRVKRLRYAPGLPLVFSDDDGQKVVNTYRFTPPVPLLPTPEELDLWSEFLEWVLPTGNPDCCVLRQWLLDALAWLVQDERRRLPFAMLLLGGYGCGKTTLMQEVPQTLFGKDNVGSVSHGELESPFNDWSANRRVLAIEEMSMSSARDDRQLSNKLKPLITGEVLHVHPKGFKGYEQPNTISILATSNDDGAAYLDDGERRWLVCKSPSARMPKGLGDRVHAWLEGERGSGVLRGLFLSRDTSKFNPHAPLPMTESKREMTLRSRSPIAQVLVDMFERREPPFDQPIITTDDVVKALEEEGFTEREYSAQRIAQVLYASPIRATRLPGKKRVQWRGRASTLAATSFLPTRVYVAQRDEPKQWEGVSEALLRRQREKPWSPTVEPDKVAGQQGGVSRAADAATVQPI